MGGRRRRKYALLNTYHRCGIAQSQKSSTGKWSKTRHCHPTHKTWVEGKYCWKRPRLAEWEWTWTPQYEELLGELWTKAARKEGNQLPTASQVDIVSLKVAVHLDFLCCFAWRKLHQTDTYSQFEIANVIGNISTTHRCTFPFKCILQLLNCELKAAMQTKRSKILSTTATNNPSCFDCIAPESIIIMRGTEVATPWTTTKWWRAHDTMQFKFYFFWWQTIVSIYFEL